MGAIVIAINELREEYLETKAIASQVIRKNNPKIKLIPNKKPI